MNNSWNDQVGKYLRTTGNSIAFKTISRDHKPHWSNRFVRDFYDLDYNHNNNHNWVTNKKKSNPEQSLRRFTNSINNKKHHTKNGNKFNSKFIKKIDYLTPKQSPTNKVLIGKDIYGTVDTAGLSRYQFKKTIQGKMKYKSNHHYDFSNQRQRPPNQNKVWYYDNNTITSKQPQSNRSKNKLHSFTSYTPRRVFLPKDQLDKIYSIQPCLAKIIPSFKSKKLVSFDNLSPAKQPVSPLGNQLAYDISTSFIKSKPSPRSFTMSRSQRQIQFSKEVISAERGCYR